MSGGKEFFLEQAIQTADLLWEELFDICIRMAIAGSIRRQRPMVHDIDIVVIPKDQKVLEEKLRGLGWAGNGTKMMLFEYLCMPVEIYVAEESNFYALLQMRTGSAEFNKSLAIRAKKLWKMYRAGFGIYNESGEREDDGTERGIFEALALPFIPLVQWRERDYHDFMLKGALR